MLGVHLEKIGGEQVVGFIKQAATYALWTSCISDDGGGRLQSEVGEVEALNSLKEGG